MKYSVDLEGPSEQGSDYLCKLPNPVLQTVNRGQLIPSPGQISRYCVFLSPIISEAVVHNDIGFKEITSSNCTLIQAVKVSVNNRLDSPSPPGKVHCLFIAV